MAWYPGAVRKPISHVKLVARNKQGRGMLHVAVVPYSVTSLPPSTQITWHFYIAAAAPNGATDGSGGAAYCEQYLDLDHRAAGGGEGNDDQIIVETAGGTGSSPQLNAERWTRAQELRIIDLMRWEASQPGGAPLELLPDARPGRRGWGPHRLGIKHSGGPRPGWWQPGSELWSSVLGKECPGDAKVSQIPGLINEARTGQSEEDDMYGPEDRWADRNTMAAVGRLEIAAYVTNATLAKLLAEGDNDLTADDVSAAIQAGVAAGVSDVSGVVRQVILDTVPEAVSEAQADDIVRTIGELLTARPPV